MTDATRVLVGGCKVVRLEDIPAGRFIAPRVLVGGCKVVRLEKIPAGRFCGIVVLRVVVAFVVAGLPVL